MMSRFNPLFLKGLQLNTIDNDTIVRLELTPDEVAYMTVDCPDIDSHIARNRTVFPELPEITRDEAIVELLAFREMSRINHMSGGELYRIIIDYPDMFPATTIALATRALKLMKRDGVA